ncbi:MAG: acyl-ACP--UDP-N-acetylglucosamine O-acyltransferase [Planctomycetota bacterium]
MTTATATDVHPTAIIDESATLGEGVTVGAGALIGPNCVIGAHTRVREKAVVVQDTTIGERNDLHPYCVIGGDPQDRAHKDDDLAQLFVGDDNVFREFVTISRGTAGGEPTRIGNRNMFMASSHAGHNVQIGSDCAFANSASISGHAIVGDRCIFSGFTGVHQFCEIGTGVMFSAHCAVSKHVPPFTIVSGPNTTAGININGLRRYPGVTSDDRREMKELYRTIFRREDSQLLNEAIAEARAKGTGIAGTIFLDFLERAMGHEGRFARGLVTGINARVKGQYGETD